MFSVNLLLVLDGVLHPVLFFSLTLINSTKPWNNYEDEKRVH